MNIPAANPPAIEGYELIDSGDGRKLERIGGLLVSRPEPQAIWRPADPAAWTRANDEFDGAGRGGNGWARNIAPQREGMTAAYGGLRLRLRFHQSGHIGLFPEQATAWAAMAAALARRPAGARMLNLFGYTGAASLVAQRAGWAVTHVDASKPALNAAAENQQLSALPRDGVRWICDDCVKFAQREVRRGNRYDALLLDPPAMGHGPKGELWKLEDALHGLTTTCRDLLAEDFAFLFLTVYATRLSPRSVDTVLREILPRHEPTVVELGLIETNDRHRFLPLAHCFMITPAGRGVSQ